MNSHSLRNYNKFSCVELETVRLEKVLHLHPRSQKISGIHGPRIISESLYLDIYT